MSHAKRAQFAALAMTLAASVSVANAQAEELSRPVPASRQGASFDLRLSAGGAAAEYRQHSTGRAALDSLSLDAAFRWGGFVDSHFLLGYEARFARHTDVGTPTIYSSYVTEFYPQPHEGYTIIAPLGAFLELYPIDGEGFYLGGSASAGLLSLPEFADEDSGLVAGYAAEIGYDTSASGKQGLGFFLRYSHWSGSAIISDHGDELAVDEVALGARWAFPASL